MKSLHFILCSAVTFSLSNFVIAQKLPPGGSAYSQKKDTTKVTTDSVRIEPSPSKPKSTHNIQIGEVDAYGVGSIDNSDGMIEGDQDIGTEAYSDLPPVQHQVAQKEQSRETQVAVHSKKSSKSKTKTVKKAKVKSKKKSNLKQAKNTKSSKKVASKKKQPKKQSKKA